MAFIQMPRTKTIRELIGILDSEYDVLMDMKKSDVVIYLIEVFCATPAESEEAVSSYGAWD